MKKEAVILQNEVEKFLIGAGLDLADVRTHEDGITKYSFSLNGVTCILNFYDYTNDDLTLSYLFFEFGVGSIARSDANQKISDACVAMYDCAWPFRVGVPPFEGDCLMTLAFRSEVSAVPTWYAVELIGAAIDIAEELRQILQIDPIGRSAAS